MWHVTFAHIQERQLHTVISQRSKKLFSFLWSFGFTVCIRWLRTLYRYIVTLNINNITTFNNCTACVNLHVDLKKLTNLHPFDVLHVSRVPVEGFDRQLKCTEQTWHGFLSGGGKVEKTMERSRDASSKERSDHQVPLCSLVPHKCAPVLAAPRFKRQEDGHRLTQGTLLLFDWAACTLTTAVLLTRGQSWPQLWPRNSSRAGFVWN